MSFEILNRDLAGRIGRLKTRRGAVETPLLLPVVNPFLQPFSTEQMCRDFDCQAVIANAYLLKKNFEREVLTRGVHAFLKFHDTVVTDSGAYQILVYGDVDVSPEEIIRFQEEIKTDIAVILDIPTGWNTARERAEYTVYQTLERARASLNVRTENDTLWVGPVQGGTHLDLVSHSATEIGKMPFDIYALGSPTQVIERYLFDVLVDMIIAAKKNLPVDKPLHLFGAGHPFMFAFAVALGCDIFDSAAYAIYARRGKYMTNSGTKNLKDLRYFPCSCKVCTKYTPLELIELPFKERESYLAWHNLRMCFTEIERIKQAIDDGRLWELLELRSKGHPSLYQAFKHLRKYSNYFEYGTPISKSKGMFFFGSLGISRPEVVRYRSKIKLWKLPSDPKVLILLSEPSSKPFHLSKEYIQIHKLLYEKLGENINKIHCSFCVAPFGVIPLELDETYPLSQFETAFPLDLETENYMAKQVEDYLRMRSGYGAVVVQLNPLFGEKIEHACKRAIKPEKLTILPNEDNVWGLNALKNLVNVVNTSVNTLNGTICNS